MRRRRIGHRKLLAIPEERQLKLTNKPMMFLRIFVAYNCQETFIDAGQDCVSALAKLDQLGLASPLLPDPSVVLPYAEPILGSAEDIIFLPI